MYICKCIYICTQTSVLTDGYQKSASNCDWSFYPRCARACPRGRNSSCTCLGDLGDGSGSNVGQWELSFINTHDRSMVLVYMLT